MKQFKRFGLWWTVLSRKEAEALARPMFWFMVLTFPALWIISRLIKWLTGS